MKSECIDFRTLPGQNDLFLAYLHDFETVAPFYSPLPFTRDDLDERVAKVLRAQHLSRHALMPVLRKLNSDFNQHEAVARNLDKLESMDTLAVLTGQQVGLFGGPCYGVYKAASAVQVAAYLESRGYSAVPVFWLASDDSDFEEVRSVQFFDDDGSLAGLRHPDERKHSRQMAGTVPVNSATLVEFLEKLRGPASLDEIIQLIEASYGPGSSFRDGFASWLAGLFGRYGLVLFDPLGVGYREHLKDFVRIALHRRDDLVTTVQQRGNDLRKAGFPVQVRVEETETFLFLIDPPNRFKLEFRNGYFEAKGRRSFRFDLSELQHGIEKDEITVGVNVLLRPILQEYLFPTFGSVTGPAEIAYLGQVSSLSSYWDQEIAAIPRAAFTIIDRKAQRLLERYDLQAEEILKLTPLQLAEEILRQGQAAAVLDDFDRLRRNLSARLLQLREKIAAEDSTIPELLDGASRKMHYQIDKVCRRFVLNHFSHEGHREGHLAYLGNHLFPRNALQERVLNFNSFLTTEGHGLVDQVVSKIDPENVSHQLLYL